MAPTDRPASRLVFVILGGPLTLVLIAVATLTITGTLARQSESTQLAFTEPITRLRIDITDGSITLRGGNLRSVTGERIVTRGLQAPAFHERVDGDTLIIESTCNPIGNTWCDVTYVLDVPRELTIVAETALGSIQASDLTGSADLKSATGRVEVEGLSGQLRMESGAGSVRGSALSSPTVQASSGAGAGALAFTAPPGYVDAGAGAGSTDVEVPRDGTTYRVEESSGDDQSNVRIAVTTDPTSPNVLRVSSGAGGVSVHYPEA